MRGRSESVLNGRKLLPLRGSSLLHRSLTVYANEFD